jgi:hypothetical protein
MKTHLCIGPKKPLVPQSRDMIDFKRGEQVGGPWMNWTKVKSTPFEILDLQKRGRSSLIGPELECPFWRNLRKRQNAPNPSLECVWLVAFT